MSLIDVAVPMRRGRRRFSIEKGRRWSVVEHLMLDAVARTPSTTEALAKKSCLHPRVVIEAFIRLMRVGWVELLPAENGLVFTATPLGKSQLGASELRSATTRDQRWMSFCYDQVQGNVFRGRELYVYKSTKLERSPESQGLVYLDRSLAHQTEDMSAIFAALAGEDEVVVGMEPNPEPLFQGYAMVKVKGGNIEGLPPRASEELREIILSKAADILPPKEKKTVPRVDSVDRALVGPSRQTQGLFEQRDLILGGPEHRSALHRVLDTATDLVIIHSTFIYSDSWRQLLPRLIGTAARGAKIHVLWGQSDDQNESSSSRTEAIAFRAELERCGRTDQIVVHSFTTGSHAKLLLSDNGKGQWSCIVGSCNWLSSDFASYEASINVRDPKMVGELLGHIATMSYAHDGIWTQTAANFTALGRRVASMPKGPGRTAKIRLLRAPDHASLVLAARDAARKRIVVTSHRLGIASKPIVIVPALAAYHKNQVECSLFYGRATGALSNLDAASLTRELTKSGVTPRPVFSPRLHAKALAWDDDALAVTSQNWLSADPADTAYRREIGIFVEQNKLADTFIRRFDLARSK